MSCSPVLDTYLVPFDGSFNVEEASSAPPVGIADKRACKKRLKALVREIYELQRKLYASGTHSLLLVFQAMDAAGKDSTIRAILTGVNPAGCSVYSFKQPSSEELDHDFLWRTGVRFPERGRIGVFNRSYYEEVLVARVHPEILQKQRLPQEAVGDALWTERYESIVSMEEHLKRNGTLVLKFWLNVSHAEQARRFLARVENIEKNWKFSASDCQERGFWHEHMAAYESALNATSRPWAPWYAIPADDKPYMRMKVAEIVVKTLRDLDLTYPTVGAAARKRLEEVRPLLEQEVRLADAR